MSKEPKRIQSIERGFALLEALSIHDQPMTLQSITEACSTEQDNRTWFALNDVSSRLRE
ncbi:hypothetical protein JCM19239_6100 [Vibrio variabilis]|uniref:HTH iclR-type domain-containing protein n=1 Tax=Vibrio variabilis TaxID=990271 RepID=A0ABQ0JJS7_9VIBR|nr:hypothetical protein JCM19239_6100 [Vibrio variabilis]